MFIVNRFLLGSDRRSPSRLFHFTAVLIAFSLLQFANTVQAQDWRSFLGTDSKAHSTDQVPVEWDQSKNMLWTLPLPGGGSSSPIIVGDRVLVTCYSQTGGKISRQVICVNKKSGDKLWAKSFDVDYDEDAYQGYLREHGYASNTPVSDGEHVFVFFGKGGVHALDLDGNVKWSVQVGKESSNRRWGSGSSLLLTDSAVVVNAAEESRSIIALDKTNGKEIWKKQAGLLELTFGSPRLVELKDGKKQIVISVPGEIWGMNPKTGGLKWLANTPMTGNVSPSVIIDGETIYSFGGYRSSGSVSVRAGGKGDVSETHTNWTSRSSSYVATPLLHDGKFYWLDDRGLANSTNAKDGKEIYRVRVSGLSGRPVYASPVYIGSKIYVPTRRAGTIVFEPGDEFKELARNKIAGDDTDFNASPAVSDSRLYLRSNQALYCIGEK